MLSERLTTIHLAADHAGFPLKEFVKKWLQGSVYEIVDHGALENHPLDDFPDFIIPAAYAVSKQPDTSCAFIFGGSGQGEAMAANRIKGVRATVYYGGNREIIKLSREHNAANILSFGARFVSKEETKNVILEWLAAAEGTDEKYQRRNQKIDTLADKITNKT